MIFREPYSSGPAMLELETAVPVPGLVILTARGEIDLTSQFGLNGALATALTQYPQTLVVDFTRITFCGAVGLAELVEVNRGCVAQSARLMVIPSRIVLRALVATGLADDFAIHGSRDEVLSCLSVN